MTVQKWDSDQEFEEGTFNNTEIIGVGDDAVSKLSLDVPSINYDFTTPSNYTYDPAKIEFVTGVTTVARPKEIKPADSICYANYYNSIDLTWGIIPLTGTPNGSPTITGEKLDCTGAVQKGVFYQITNDGDATIRLKYTPDYSGAPSTNVNVCGVQETTGSNNKILLSHSPAGDNFRVTLWDSTGAQILLAQQIGPSNINLSAGVSYEIELSWDNTAGYIYLYIDGTRYFLSIGAWTWAYNSARLYVGAMPSPYNVADAFFDDLIMFNSVQHTGSSYTPGESIPDTWYVVDSSILTNVGLEFINYVIEFTETVTTPSGTGIKYQIEIDGSLKWWSGSAWVDITPSQTDQWYYDNEANTESEITANLSALPQTGIVKVRIFLRSAVMERPAIDKLFVKSGDEYPTSGSWISQQITEKRYYYAISFDVEIPDDTTTTIYIKKSMTGKWFTVTNNEEINEKLDFFQWKIEMTSAGLDSPVFDTFIIEYETVIYQYNGWNIDKEKISYYAFGNKELVNLVDNLVCEEAVEWLYSELEFHKEGLSSNLDKTNALLNQAIIFRAACMLVKSGHAVQRSGVVMSESLEGKSVSYANIPQEQPDMRFKGRKVKSQDWCGMAEDMVARYAEQKVPANKGIGISRRNYREKIFRETRDKYGWRQ